MVVIVLGIGFRRLLQVSVQPVVLCEFEARFRYRFRYRFQAPDMAKLTDFCTPRTTVGLNISHAIHATNYCRAAYLCTSRYLRLSPLKNGDKGINGDAGKYTDTEINGDTEIRINTEINGDTA